MTNRPYSYSTKEPGSSDVFIHFHSQILIEWRLELRSQFCAFEDVDPCAHPTLRHLEKHGLITNKPTKEGDSYFVAKKSKDGTGWVISYQKELRKTEKIWYESRESKFVIGFRHAAQQQ